MNGKFDKLMEKLSADEQLMEKLMEQETPEEAQSILKEADFEFNITEIMELREEIIKLAAQNENGELSDDELAGVAGGVSLDGLVNGANDIIQGHGGSSIGLPKLRRPRLPRFRRPRRW